MLYQIQIRPSHYDRQRRHSVTADGLLLAMIFTYLFTWLTLSTRRHVLTTIGHAALRLCELGPEMVMGPHHWTITESNPTQPIMLITITQPNRNRQYTMVSVGAYLKVSQDNNWMVNAKHKRRKSEKCTRSNRSQVSRAGERGLYTRELRGGELCDGTGVETTND